MHFSTRKIKHHINKIASHTYFLPALVIALVALATTTLLTIFLSTPRPAKLKLGSGDTLYTAGNKIFNASIGKKDGSQNITFNVGDSSANFVLSGSTPSTPKKSVNTVTFPSSLKNIDLKYTPTVNGLKEEIILHEKPTDKTGNTFLFDLNFTNVAPSKLTNNFLSPTFKDSKGKYKFHFEKPFAFDASGSRTNNVLLQIMEDKQLPGKYSMKLIVDETWLNSPTRTYPITIDPTIIHDTTAEFAAGTLNRLKDFGSGSAPMIETAYQPLVADKYTVALWHMDEASGNILDSSGNSNTGTVTGTTVDTSTQKLGIAARTFNGTSDSINGSNSTIYPKADLTLEAWFKTTTNGQKAIITHGTTSDWLYWLGTDTNMINCKIYQAASGSGYLQVTPTVNYYDGNWHHLACTVLGTTVSIYMDGVMVGTSSTTTGTRDVSTAGNFYIGKFDWTTTYNFAGTIDEVRISNIARSEEEIKTSASRRSSAIYTSPVLDLGGAGSFITIWNPLTWLEQGVTTGDGETLKDSTNLVAQWNFNETSGTTATNNAGSCGASCNGTLTSFSSTSSQDQAAGTGWTSDNKRWGAGAIMLDGSDDYVSVPDNSTLNSSTFSYAAWINIKSFSARNTIYDSGAINTPRIGTETTTGLIQLYKSGVAILCSSSTAPILGSWNNIVVTYDGTTCNIYLNGKINKTTTSSNSFSYTAVTRNIGRTYGGVEYFNGTIDSLTIFSRILTPSEILSNYQAGNIELQTRVGSDASPDDGSWDAWSSTASETSIDNLDNPLDYATPSSSIQSGVLLATSSATIPLIEGTKNLKITNGTSNSLTDVVGLWHLDETGGTGAYLHDSTSNANHGTPNGTTLVKGISGKGRNFNGTSDYVDITNSTSLQLTNNFTMEAWFYRNSDSGGFERIISKSDSTSYDYWMQIGSTDLATCGVTIAAGTNYSISTTIAIPTGNLIHLACTLNSSNSWSIYVNGALNSTTSSGTAGAARTTTRNLNFGRLGSSGSFLYGFNGTIDEVKISNITRSAEEIAESYRMGRDHYINKTISSTDLSGKTSLPFYVAADRPGTYLQSIIGESNFANYQPDTNTIGLWHLDEKDRSGAHIKDLSGNSYHGSASGTTNVQGKIGTARNFTAATHYLSFGNYLPINSASDISIDAWLYPTAQTAATHFRAFSKQSIVYVGQYGGQISFYMGTGAAWTISDITGGALPLNQWSHVAWVKSGTSYYIYLNGQLTKSGTGAPATLGSNSNTTYIGSYDGTTQNWLGAIDEMRVSNSVRTADEIRQAYEVGSRMHNITIDFGANLDSGNLIADINDLSFTVDATAYGLTSKGSMLFVGDKVIVRENYDGTEYISQGTVTAVTESTGAVTIASWDSGSTFPSGGYTSGASVFKWQREYINIDGEIQDSSLNAITQLSLRLTNGLEGRTIYLDDLRSSGGYLTNPAGSTITSNTGSRYMQYRAILSSFDAAVSATLSAVTIDYTINTAPATPSLTSPSDGTANTSTTPTLQTSATDTDSDYLRYKFELCSDVGMTVGCQTFDQTSSQTGWSGQNAQTSTAYTSGSTATYTIQSALSTATTYYWRSYAIDPAGTNTWSGTQTPRSFTTTTTPSAPTTPYTEGSTNPTGVVDSTPEFSAVHADVDGDPAVYYEIEVNANNTFTGTVMWDSTQTSMTSTANGLRSPDISYAGSTLSWSTLYYWRIRFTDSLGATGSWSATQSFTMNTTVATPSLLSPSNTANNVNLSPTLQTSATDTDSDYLRYKFELCSDVGMTVGCQTFDQTSSQTGWSGQNAQTSTAYTSGSTASYTLSSTLTPATTYYYRSYAIDPAGTNIWSSTQGTVNSFTTRLINESLACLITETKNDTSLTITWTDRETVESDYRLERSLDSAPFSPFQTLPANTTSYIDSSITEGHTYQYRIAPYFSSTSIYGNWCTTNSLSIQVGVFNFSNLNFNGINFN